MKNKTSPVLPLFAHDPIFRVMVRFYETSPLWRYVLITFFYMYLLSVALHFIYEQKTGIANPSSPFFWGHLLVFGLAPILGSWFGHQWLCGFLSMPEELVSTGVLSAKTAHGFCQTLREKASKPWTGFVAMATLLPVGILAHLAWENASPSDPFTAADGYNWIVMTLWWYLIVKAAVVCLLTLFLWHKKIHVDEVNIQLFHEDPQFGLKPLVDFTWRFLYLHVLVIGGYLLVSAAGLYRSQGLGNTLTIAFAIIFAYVAIPAIWLWLLVGRFSVAISRMKAEKIRQVRQALSDLEATTANSQQTIAQRAPEVVALMDELEHLERIQPWPIKKPAAITFAVTYLVPLINHILEVRNAIQKLLG